MAHAKLHKLPMKIQLGHDASLRTNKRKISNGVSWHLRKQIHEETAAVNQHISVKQHHSTQRTGPVIDRLLQVAIAN